MLPTNWPSDYDYAEAHGNGRHETQVRRMPVSHREVILRRMERDPLTQALAASLRALYGSIGEPSGPACAHGIDTSRAGCGRCLRGIA